MLSHFFDSVISKELLQAKNADNQIQRIISEAAEAGKAASSMQSEQFLGSEDQRRIGELRARMLETARIGRELLQLIVSSSEFRDLLNSIITMANFMFLSTSVLTWEPRSRPRFLTNSCPAFLDIRDEAKDKAQAASTVQQAVVEGAEAARAVATDFDRIPERDRIEFYQKLKDVVRKVNSSHEWRQGVHNMFALLDRFEYGAKEMGEKTAQKAMEVKLDRHAEAAVSETKELVEKFLPEHKTLDPLIDRLKQLVFAIRGDNELREYFMSARDYLNESLDSPVLLEEESYRRRGEELIDRGRSVITKEEYRSLARDVLNEWQEVIKGFRADDQLSTSITPRSPIL